MEGKAISLWLSAEIRRAKSSLMHSTQSLGAMCYRIYRIFYIRKDLNVDLKTHSRTALLPTAAIQFT